MVKDYIYQSSNGLINVNTLSPSGNFYYRIKAPKSLNPSAFGCEIAFYNNNSDLIYHRSKVYAHELHSKEEIKLARQEMELGQFNEKEESSSIEIVKWSIQGNFAYFLEHYRWNYEKLYESVFLNLKEQYCYRINELNNNFEIINTLNLKNRNYDEIEINKKLEILGFKPEEPIKDKIQNNFFAHLFNLNKWQPV